MFPTGQTPLLLQCVGGPSLAPEPRHIMFLVVCSVFLGKFPALKSFNIIPLLLRKCQIKEGVTVMFFRMNAFIMASWTSTHAAQCNMWCLVRCCMCSSTLEVQAIHERHQNTTFLTTNAGRQQLFDLSTWHHDTLVIMHNNATCCRAVKLARISQWEG